jgi:hypothetical protein
MENKNRVKKTRIQLAVGMFAVTLCMISSCFAGRTIGWFPLWMITWVLSMIAYGTLFGPVKGIIQAAKECEREKDED